MGIRRITIIAIMIGIAGCSDLGLEPPRAPAEVILSPDTLFLVEGQEERLELRINDHSGRVIDPVPTWADIRWSTSPPGLVSLDGAKIKGIKSGAARIDAAVAGLRHSMLVFVNPARVRVQVAAYYLTQGTQRLDGSVPLVPGKDALLRVFLTGDVASFFRPTVTVDLLQADGSKTTFPLRRELFGVPLDVQRGNLGASWNAHLPGSLIRPGSSIAITVTTDGGVEFAPGSEVRVPESGSIALDVTPVPNFYVRFVPVQLSQHGTVGELDPTDPQEFARLAYEMHPFSEIDIDVRPVPFISEARLDASDGWGQLLREIRLLRAAENSDRYYYGIVRPPSGTGTLGTGYIGLPAAVGADDLPETFAHELGHNFGLSHSPCGVSSGTDPEFPYAGGSIGTFGYSISRQELYNPSSVSDLMSYCRPRWMSDYNYMKVLHYRDTYDWGMTGSDAFADSTRDVLILWGEVGGDRPILEPAFRMPAPVILPEADGPYWIEGRDELGARIFSFSFSGAVVDHNKTSRHFLFGVPLASEDFERLHDIRLIGPTAIAERVKSRSFQIKAPTNVQMDQSSRYVLWPVAEYPAAIIRDVVTGSVLGINRSGVFEKTSGSKSVEILLSNGVGSVRVELE